MTNHYYPTSPNSVPKSLTKLPFSYLLKSILSILAIVLFFVLYVSMVIGLGYLFYYAIIYDMGYINKLTIIMKVGAIAGAAMLFVFSLKFIFKLKNHKPNNRILLKKEEHTDLWNFIEKICEETGAPRPKNIYLDPDVNAYVAYSNMWLSLFLPVRKELTIGMGLTDCLNLSEFKAVISHEFGHFSQRSMKIGSYIISANTIIHNMIFERDKWDDTLDQWRASDIRLSAAAWLITPIIWLIRQMLNLFYQFLNVMYSSLSREMEFNADKVAVKTSGSEAIISALWKLNGGSTVWHNTLNHAILASKKNLYVENIYINNALALEREAPHQAQLLESLQEDKRGGRMYFTDSEHSKVGMYASHPPNDKREHNAKTPYVVCDQDTRSPWILFGEKSRLQTAMTLRLYEIYLQKKPTDFVQAQVLEEFIKSETQGAHLAKEYDNTFSNRFLQIPNPQKLNAQMASLKPSKKVLKQLKLEVKDLMQPIHEIEALMIKAQEIAQGTTKVKTFSFNGIEYSKKNLENGYNFLLNKREEHFNLSFENWDTKFCAFFTLLAKEEARDNELAKLYAQHQAITFLYRSVTTTKNSILNKVTDLQNAGEITNEQLQGLTARVKDFFRTLNQEVNALDKLHFVEMPNVESIEELKEALVDNSEFKIENGLIFENGGFQKMMNQLESTIYNCQRIEQKSISCILLFHKNLELLLAD
ncbi:M48 family metalloprotease [Maribacter sp. MAR_2009_72]|uniref:M48 family metalloprotease n=1 Tax=Maribacter sp. MAR_2009_72 TaxID=1250050 RepID=UPI00119B6A5C|nr:M48 family metallopeptidase [Maribacter sp. MAR_2009_72]TVZ16190.1 Zn-dependent protease with chaperone function [Maribacter sp. MAR_2009_72]